MKSVVVIFIHIFLYSFRFALRPSFWILRFTRRVYNSTDVCVPYVHVITRFFIPRRALTVRRKAEKKNRFWKPETSTAARTRGVLRRFVADGSLSEVTFLSSAYPRDNVRGECARPLRRINADPRRRAFYRGENVYRCWAAVTATRVRIVGRSHG